MMNYEIVSTKLSPDYIKAFDYMCQKLSISREDFLKKCVEQLVFRSCNLSTDCDLDYLWGTIDEMGLKLDHHMHYATDIFSKEEIREWDKNHGW
jgi:hypothetical protein